MSFLSDLRAAREAATPGPWHSRSKQGKHLHGSVLNEVTGIGHFDKYKNADYICLLVNNAEKLEELIRTAAGTVRTAHRQKIGDAVVPAWWEALVAALAALDEPGEAT